MIPTDVRIRLRDAVDDGAAFYAGDKRVNGEHVIRLTAKLPDGGRQVIADSRSMTEHIDVVLLMLRWRAVQRKAA